MNTGTLLASVLLAPITPAPPSPTSQDVVDRVKSLLSGFGVPGHLRLQKLTSLRGPNVRFREVVVMDPRGNAYMVQVGREGRIVSIHDSKKQPEPLAGGKRRSLTGVERERHARRLRAWLKATGTREPTRLDSLTEDEKGVGRAYFPILRNGHPFVSYPRFGYDFTFDSRTAQFLSFRASQNPPPVDPRPPKLDKKGALAALKHVWDTQITPRALNERRWRWVWYTLDGEPELGYYLPEGQSTAILVWKIRFQSYRDVGHAIQGGDSGMLIDAITGNQVLTRTVP